MQGCLGEPQLAPMRKSLIVRLPPIATRGLASVATKSPAGLSKAAAARVLPLVTRGLVAALLLMLAVQQTVQAAVPRDVAPALSSAVAYQAAQQAMVDFWPLLAAGLAWLFPAGLILIAVAGLPAERAGAAALAGAAAAGLAIAAFFAVGFGLAFGGLGLVHDQVAGYDGLIWEWSALGTEWGAQWGMAGLEGWALAGDTATPEVYALFFAQLPWVASAALVPVLALRGRSPTLVTVLSGLLVGGLLYPLATNWTWGGGWLANLGVNLNLGHGYVDFASSGPIHLLGGAFALAALLVLVRRRPRRDPDRQDEPVPLPPVHLPVLASVGALLVLAGSLGWAWANPLLEPNVTAGHLMPMRGAVNAALAAAGGALLPLAYIWLATGRADPLMAARGLAVGAVAGAAVGPFVPPHWALALGAVAGLLLPFITYLVTELFRVADDTGIVAVHLAGGLLGLLAVGVLADGEAGAGWNQVGAVSYLGVPGQGVTGLLAATGNQPDWPGQFQAQLIGVGVLFLLPFLVATVIFGPLAVLAQGLRRADADDTSYEQEVVEAQPDPSPELASEPAAQKSGATAAGSPS